MEDKLAKLIAFHTAFGIGHTSSPDATIPEEIFRLRHRLMAEENDEYLEACEAQDLEAIADALGDQLYVLCGTMITHGLQDKITAIFDEIHRSNMSKLDEHGNPVHRADGKVVKSDRYFPPNLKPILSSDT